MGVRVGVDTGGTFTDLMAWNDAGEVFVHKTPSTPDDNTRALVDGLAVLGEKGGFAPGDVESVAHGTTVATIYLRVQESHELELPAGSYLVKYASGSASNWRGPIYYFGSSTSFHKGDYKNIGTNEILSLTFYQIVTRGSSAGGIPTISAEEFDR